MKPAIYQPGEKIIVAGTIQWGTHIHCKAWAEVVEYSMVQGDFDCYAQLKSADDSGVLSKLIECRLYRNGEIKPLNLKLFSDEQVKSIMATQIHNKWCARIRTNHREMFFGFEYDYTMHQAQMLSDSITNDVKRNGLIDAIYSNKCLVSRPI